MLDTSMKFLGGENGTTETCEETLRIAKHLERFLQPSHQFITDLKSRFLEQLLKGDEQNPEMVETGLKFCYEIGKVVNVLIEQEHAGTGKLIGRTARFSPDVDGVIYLDPSPQGDTASLGSMAIAKITDADHYDLYGHLATASEVLAFQK